MYVPEARQRRSCNACGQKDYFLLVPTAHCNGIGGGGSYHAVATSTSDYNSTSDGSGVAAAGDDDDDGTHGVLVRDQDGGSPCAGASRPSDARGKTLPRRFTPKHINKNFSVGVPASTLGVGVPVRELRADVDGGSGHGGPSPLFLDPSRRALSASIGGDGGGGGHGGGGVEWATTTNTKTKPSILLAVHAVCVLAVVPN